jgi:hypothetical protein
MLYVGIIAVIQEHAHDHCHGRMSGHVYIYPNPMGHTLKSFASIEYEFGIRSKREEDSKSGPGKSQNGSIVSWLVPEGSKNLPMIYGKVPEEIWSNRSIYGMSGIDQKGPEGSGMLWKVLESTKTTRAVLGSLEGSIIGVSMLHLGERSFPKRQIRIW